MLVLCAGCDRPIGSLGLRRGFCATDNVLVCDECAAYPRSRAPSVGGRCPGCDSGLSRLPLWALLYGGVLVILTAVVSVRFLDVASPYVLAGVGVALLAPASGAVLARQRARRHQAAIELFRSKYRFEFKARAPLPAPPSSPELSPAGSTSLEFDLASDAPEERSADAIRSLKLNSMGVSCALRSGQVLQFGWAEPACVLAVSDRSTVPGPASPPALRLTVGEPVRAAASIPRVVLDQLVRLAVDQGLTVDRRAGLAGGSGKLAGYSTRIHHGLVRAGAEPLSEGVYPELPAVRRTTRELATRPPG